LKKALLGLFLAGTLVVTPACYTFQHQVGSGGSGGETVQESSWWILWGLVPLTKPNSKEMAGGATDYTVTTQFTFIDVIITAITGWVTIHKQTVTVEK
jgi:hypothetical protein